MRIISLVCGDETFFAELNDTVAAKDFVKRLPLNVSLSDSGKDFYCQAAKGIFSPADLCDTIRKGDICLAGGYFFIYYDDEETVEKRKNIITIGHIEGLFADRLKNIDGKINLSIDLI